MSASLPHAGARIVMRRVELIITHIIPKRSVFSFTIIVGRAIIRVLALSIPTSIPRDATERAVHLYPSGVFFCSMFTIIVILTKKSLKTVERYACTELFSIIYFSPSIVIVGIIPHLYLILYFFNYFSQMI